VSRDCRAAVRRAAAALGDADHPLVDAAPPHPAEVRAAYDAVVVTEVIGAVRALVADREDELSGAMGSRGSQLVTAAREARTRELPGATGPRSDETRQSPIASSTEHRHGRPRLRTHRPRAAPREPAG
jgi:hypothetical protein